MGRARPHISGKSNENCSGVNEQVVAVGDSSLSIKGRASASKNAGANTTEQYSTATIDLYCPFRLSISPCRSLSLARSNAQALALALTLARSLALLLALSGGSDEALKNVLQSAPDVSADLHVP